MEMAAFVILNWRTGKGLEGSTVESCLWSLRVWGASTFQWSSLQGQEESFCQRCLEIILLYTILERKVSQVKKNELILFLCPQRTW